MKKNVFQLFILFLAILSICPTKVNAQKKYKPKPEKGIRMIHYVRVRLETLTDQVVLIPDCPKKGMTYKNKTLLISKIKQPVIFEISIVKKEDIREQEGYYYGDDWVYEKKRIEARYEVYESVECNNCEEPCKKTTHKVMVSPAYDDYTITSKKKKGKRQKYQLSEL
jgi:hypothetical protein